MVKKKSGHYGDLLIVVSWILIIFLFSSCDAKTSTSQTKLVINFLNKMSEHSYFINYFLFKINSRFEMVYAVRKLAHLTIFCILQMISFIVLRRKKKSILKCSIYSIVIVILYAICDELHQYFTPGRSCSLKDVFIDTTGGIVGLSISYIILLIKFIFKKITKKNIVRIRNEEV